MGSMLSHWLCKMYFLDICPPKYSYPIPKHKRTYIYLLYTSDWFADKTYDDKGHLLASAIPYTRSNLERKNNHPLMHMVRFTINKLWSDVVLKQLCIFFFDLVRNMIFQNCQSLLICRGMSFFSVQWIYWIINAFSTENT